MSFSKVTNGIKNRDDANDEIYTPISLAKKLIKKLNLKNSSSCYDPFYGTGSFFNNFHDNAENDWSEINLGKDFFKNEKSFDWVISNPPFSQLSKIIEKTCEISNEGFGYILPSYSLTTSRIRLARSKGFNLNKMIFFDNPKSWGIGFQMVFAVWTKENSDNIDLIDQDNTIQVKLEVSK